MCCTPPGSQPHLLLVEDDHDLRIALISLFEGHSFRVTSAATVHEGAAALARDRPALVIVDVGLPDGDGLALVREACHRSVPSLVLSAADAEQDRENAFLSGAEDFVAKPYASRELVLRVRARLRNGRPDAESTEPNDTAGGLRIDENGRRCFVGTDEVNLTKTQFDILALLLRHPRQVLTQRQIAEGLDRYGYDETRLAQTHVSGLRSALRRCGVEPITTVRGVGYRFDP